MKLSYFTRNVEKNLYNTTNGGHKKMKGCHIDLKKQTIFIHYDRGETTVASGLR